MKRQISQLALSAAIVFGLAGCGMAHSSASKKPVMKTESVGNTQVKWEVFNGVNWAKKHKGLQIQIEKVAITKNIPNYELGNQKSPAIKVSFKLQNHSSRPFLINPDSAVLDTSKEDFIVPDDHISGYKGGEIELKPGDSKSGTLGYYLKPNVKVNKIDWVEWKLTATKYLVNDKRDKDYDTGKIKIHTQ